MDDEARKVTERWFVRRGLPHFIHPYRATEDVFTRMLPVLAFILVVQVVGDAADERWSPEVNGIVMAAVLVVLVAGYAVQNLLRGRPAFARPERVGPRELSVFVLLPAVPPLVKDLDWLLALGNIVFALGVLAVIYVVTSFGLVPMARWTLTHGFSRILSAASVLLRALPLLLLIIIVVFVNMEAWQVADGLEWSTVVIVVGLFFALGAAFATLRVPRQIGEGIVVVTDLPDELPDELDLEVPDDPASPPPMSRRERINVALVVLVSEGILIGLVVAMMFGFLVAFGMLTISPAVIERWLDVDPDALVSLSLFGQDMVLTPVLLKVSAFLAGLSGLSFTVSLLSDASYQEEFLSDLDEDLREAFAVRAVYRASEAAADPSIMPST